MIVKNDSICFVYGDMKIKVESFSNAEIPVEKSLLIANAVIYVESNYWINLLGW